MAKDDPHTRLIQRIERESGLAGLLDVLAERIPPTDLQSLLLEVARRRAARVDPARLLDQYRRDRFVALGTGDPRRLNEVERLALSLLPDGWTPVELSPVCPLGTTSAVGATDQNRVVTTMRNTEVLADGTNALALECALRRRDLLRRDPRSTARVRLAASHRALRAQPFGPGLHQHFRLWAMVTAGRDEGSFRFEIEALREHAGFYLDLVALAEAAGAVKVAFTDLEQGRRTAALEAEVIAPLAARHPAVELVLDPDRQGGRAYYAGVCFAIDGPDAQLVDGGFTTWTRRLVGSEKERLLISGMGIERLGDLLPATLPPR